MRKRWVISGIAALGLGAAFTGGSIWTARLFEQNFTATVDYWRSQGAQISFATQPASGTLIELRKSLKDLEIRFSAGQDTWTIRGDRPTLAIAPWRPTRLTIDLQQNTMLEIGRDRSEEMLRINSDHGGVRLDFTTDGQFTGLSAWITSAWMNSSLGGAFIRDLSASTSLNGVDIADHKRRSVVFTTALKDIRLDLNQTPLLGDVVTRLIVEGYVLGGFPGVDAHDAMIQWRDAGGTVEIERLVANWGPLALTANGTLALDHRLQPIGAFTATVRGYNETVDAVVAAGAMTPAQATATKLWLNAKMESDEGGAKVKLPITIQDGMLSMGPVKLAQLPPIVWQ